MISQVMRYCNKYFPKTYERSNYEIIADGIQGSFSKTYVVGQYIYVKDSLLNDGVYRITDISSIKLTLEATLSAENTGQAITVFGLTPPRDFLELVNEISNYTSKDGVASEKIDDFSVTFKGDGSWQSAFMNKLNTYKSIYNDLEALIDADNRLLYRH